MDPATATKKYVTSRNVVFDEVSLYYGTSNAVTNGGLINIKATCGSSENVITDSVPMPTETGEQSGGRSECDE